MDATPLLCNPVCRVALNPLRIPTTCLWVIFVWGMTLKQLISHVNRGNIVLLAASIADAKAHLSSCIAQVEAGEPLMITRHGRAVVAMISADEWERLKIVQGAQRRGLAALIGGWDDSDTLVEQVQAVVASRSMARPLPDLG